MDLIKRFSYSCNVFKNFIIFFIILWVLKWQNNAICTLRNFSDDLKFWHNFSMWFIIFQVTTTFQRVIVLQQRGSPGHSMRYLYFRITSDFPPFLEESPKSVHLPMKLCVSWPWLPPSLTKHYAPFFSHPPLFSVPLPSLLSAVCFLECFSSLDFFLFVLRKVFTR